MRCGITIYCSLYCIIAILSIKQIHLIVHWQNKNLLDEYCLNTIYCGHIASMRNDRKLITVIHQ